MKTRRLIFFKAISITAVLAVQILPGIRNAHALIVHNSETDFLSAATIVTTETFDGYTNNYGFITKQIAIDGVVYTTDVCTNRCWNFDGNNITPPNGLISNAIGINILSFGSGHYVEAVGFFFRGGSLLIPGQLFLGWEIIVNEIDGSSSLISIQPSNALTLAYFGYLSDVGIGEIIVRDNPGDGRAGNWIYDNVSRSSIIGGDPLPNSTPVPPPGLGGPCCPTDSAGEPVPEPATLLLLGSGLVALGAVRGRALTRRG